MLHHWPVSVTLDDKQLYLIVHAILMTLKQMVWEEELVNLTGDNRNQNLHSEQNTAIPYFLVRCENQWKQFNWVGIRRK